MKKTKNVFRTFANQTKVSFVVSGNKQKFAYLVSQNKFINKVKLHKAREQSRATGYVRKISEFYINIIRVSYKHVFFVSFFSSEMGAGREGRVRQGQERGANEVVKK